MCWRSSKLLGALICVKAPLIFLNDAHLALQKDAPLHREVQRFGAIVAIPILAMGIRDRPISPQSPWQNGYAEHSKVLKR